MDWILLGIFCLLCYMHLETRILRKSYISFNQVTKGAKGFKVAHLSDVHIGRFYVSKHTLRRILEKEQPDCIVWTGDYIENYLELLKFEKLLEAIHIPNIPMMMIWGNHDHKVFKKGYYEAVKAVVTKFGVRVLENEHIMITKAGQSICLIGLDPLLEGEQAMHKAFEGAQADLRIVLTHNPDTFFQIESHAFDILLSGHFHGGQIYMPFHFEFKMLRNEKMCKLKKIRGLHHLHGRSFYIHRGLGNVMFPFRFLSPPEIAFFEFKGDA